MHTSVTRIIILLVTTLTILGSLILPELLSSLEAVFFILVMILVGIPHGSIDHVIYKHFDPSSRRGHVNWYKFYGLYLVSLVVFGMSWFILPAPSLILFIIFSAFHFGQSQLYNGIKNHNLFLKGTIYTAWGFAVIFGLLSFQFTSLVDGLELEVLFPSVLYWSSYIFLLHLVSLVLIIVGILGLVVSGSMSMKRGLIELVCLSLIHGVFYVAPPLFSFAVFFGFWHSLTVMVDEYHQLKRHIAGLTVKKFFIKLLPYSFLSLIGISLFIILADQWGRYISPFMLFFIGLSALTFPHVFYMGRFYFSIYKAKNKSKQLDFGNLPNSQTA